MKFVAVREFRSKMGQIWKDLSADKEMIITNNGKPVALLTEISEENFEEMLAMYRQAKSMFALKQMQQISAENGTNKMTLDEINEVIKEVRKESKEKKRK